MRLLRTYTKLYTFVSIAFAFHINSDLDIDLLDMDMEASIAKLFNESMDIPKRDIDNMIPTGDSVHKLSEDEMDKLFKLSDDHAPDLKAIFGDSANNLPDVKNKQLESKPKSNVEKPKKYPTRAKEKLIVVKPKGNENGRKPTSSTAPFIPPASWKIPADFRRQESVKHTSTLRPPAAGLCCYAMQCYNPCPYGVFPYQAVPVPQPIVVPGRTFYEPVVHDHPPLHEIKRIIKEDKKRHKKKRYYSSDEYTDSSSGLIFSSQEYYDDFLNIRAPGY